MGFTFFDPKKQGTMEAFSGFPKEKLELEIRVTRVSSLPSLPRTGQTDIRG